MNLHEYQSKTIFRDFGISVPKGVIAYNVKEAIDAASAIGGNVWVVKAQVHAGGRGKAGGVKLAHSIDEVAEYTSTLIGKKLITHQTGTDGLPINSVYIEEGSEIQRELYLSLLVDRSREKVVVMCSECGGMDIEKVASETPEKIFTAEVDQKNGMKDSDIKNLAINLSLDSSQFDDFSDILKKLINLFQQSDASLIEINPLIVAKNGNILALDAKINIEDNALFRQPSLSDLRDDSQEDEQERLATTHDLNYVSLDGNIACMVNGAGLAMATMDLIKLHGGEPANFLDVGGGATAERVTEAFKIILANENVEAILVNIFGGIVRCDLIAEGIIMAVKEVGVEVPVVVRLEGTNVQKGKQLLKDSDLKITAAESLTDAAKKIISLAKGRPK
ncbi:MAG: succinate--CoA ligase subunit beta [Gammaproteobacteria bacterium TMED78]|nr:MAG: succinate--CoA ligase subunit beta [Gammaproteobacteria bacterium TMED78]